MFYEQNNLGDAIQALGKACEMIERALGSSHLMSAALNAKMGTLVHILGDTTQALQLYDRVLNIYEGAAKRGANVNLEAASCEYIAAAIYAQGKDLRKALDYAERALKRRQSKLNSGHDDLLLSYAQVSKICEQFGDTRKAILFSEKELSGRMTKEYDKVRDLIFHLDVTSP